MFGALTSPAIDAVLMMRPRHEGSAFAAASKLTSLAQWLQLFDAPLAVDASAESTLPLPAKVLY